MTRFEEIWLDGEVNYHFNHFSNGSQVCAAKGLALFIGKAVLATLLAEGRSVTLRIPCAGAIRLRVVSARSEPSGDLVTASLGVGCCHRRPCAGYHGDDDEKEDAAALIRRA